MTKTLIFGLLIAFAQASVLKNVVPKEISYVPAPSILGVTSTDTSGIIVNWTVVKSDDALNPVVGYKVKVWEQQRKKTYKYELIDGQYVLVEDYVLVEFTGKVPNWKPLEVLVASDKSSAQINNIKPGIAYETRVQAYTRTGDGPLSTPMRVKFEEERVLRSSSSIEDRQVSYVPPPQLQDLSIVGLGFKVTWIPVSATEAQDPVIGYKVNVWEQLTKKVYKYEFVNGELVLIETLELVEFTGEVPNWKALEIGVPGGSSSVAHVSNLKRGLGYEVRVQAYTRRGVGPLSGAMRVYF